MSHFRTPLEINTILKERYHIQKLLGCSDFGFTYLALDAERKDSCIVKELAPLLAQRQSNNLLIFKKLSKDASHILRYLFLQDSLKMKAIPIHLYPQIRDTFTENGTGYSVRQEIRNFLLLEQIMNESGPIPSEQVKKWGHHIASHLSLLANKGIAHRNLLPSNICISLDYESTTLIDPSIAKEWYVDHTGLHEDLLDLTFTPPEQKKAFCTRGHATDLFRLSAILYTALLGKKVENVEQIYPEYLELNLQEQEIKADSKLLSAIKAGLQPEFEKRPETFNEFIEILKGSSSFFLSIETQISEVDKKISLLERLHYEAKECPACKGILENIKPLKQKTCPTCRESQLRTRTFNSRLCPNCKNGILHRVNTDKSLSACPNCSYGALQQETFLFLKKNQYKCKNCKEQFLRKKEQITSLKTEQTNSWEEWRKTIKRPKYFWVCDICEAQYDELADHQWKQYLPISKEKKIYYPNEWAKIAQNQNPYSGNTFCEICSSVFFWQDEKLTLLSAEQDPYQFAKNYQGQLLDLYHISFFGINKTSMNPGMVCSDCFTEFDQTELGLKLVKTPLASLKKRVGETQSLENWHRFAAGIPETGCEKVLEEQIEALSIQGYLEGKLFPQPKKPDLIWNGKAHYLNYNKNILSKKIAGKILIKNTTLQFSSLWKKFSIPMDAIQSCWIEKDALYFMNSNQEFYSFEIKPMILNLNLNSGNYEILLTQEDLLNRIKSLLEKKL